MSEAHATGEIARLARDVQESIEQFAHLDELLRSTLPRLADPSRDAEFNAAVKDLAGGLDEAAVHRLAMLLGELWLYWDTAEPAAPHPPADDAPRPPADDAPRRPFPEEPPVALERSALPSVMESVVNFAAYAGGAAVAGVVGNRADALVRRVLDGGRERWRARSDAPDIPLTRDDAVEVVHAAAAVHGYETGDAEPLSAELRADGSWLVRLLVDGETLAAVVPPGDPGRARVVIRVS
ncbi:hypothetical protein [Actinomadura napierensis]|uniref:Uncharacterized protein n=1 Tax=Actinomadura napierensis TaxID=267854 RepID=A0ABP5M2C4_9ACTN